MWETVIFILNNHMNYNKVYNQIIERAKSRILQGYTETHHIIPRCMGGDNSLENLIRLTAREHFLCHWLLSRLNPNNEKLAHGFLMMCRVKGKGQQRYTPSSRVFEEAKQRVSALKKGRPNPNHSIIMKGRKQSIESIEKMKATRESRGLNKQHSQKMKGNKHATANFGRKQTLAEKIQRGISQPNKKVCFIDDKEYSSISQAARILNLPQKTVWARLKSNSFTNYNRSC